MITDIYRNLHNGKWSVRQGGRIVGYASHIHARGVYPVVQPGGRERARASGQRNVHAWLRCLTIWVSDYPAGNWIPYRGRRVVCGTEREWWTARPGMLATIEDEITYSPFDDAPWFYCKNDIEKKEFEYSEFVTFSSTRRVFAVLPPQ